MEEDAESKWLHKLELSGSIAPETVWWTHHITLWSHNKLVGATP